MLALAYVDQAPDQVADHVMQERICGEIKKEIRAPCPDRRALDGSHRTLRLTLRRAEARKIMLSDEVICGFLHLFKVQRQMKPPGATREQRRPYRVVVEHIAVGSRYRRVARVKILR